MTPLIAIPAAGASTRMRGRDKLLEMVDGMPLLRRQALAARACSADVVVCLRPGDDLRRAALEGVGVTLVLVAEATDGMSASLKAAAKRCAEAQPLAILLPDVPGVGRAEIDAVVEKFMREGGDKVVRATDLQSRPGTPVIFPPRLVGAFHSLTGDRGASQILTDEEVIHFAFPDDRATMDLDTPEDWQAYRMRRH